MSKESKELLGLLDDVERVLGNLILEFEVEGEERDVWHRLQTYLETLNMPKPDKE